MLESEAKQWIKHVESSLDNITGADREYCPNVTEKEFKSKLLPILKEPFNPEAQEAYRKMVRGQRTEIYVVDNYDHTKVLHVIPSLFGENDALRRDHQLGGAIAEARKEADRNPHLWNQINAMLPSIVRENEGSYVNHVIKPILAVLGHYGEIMTIPTPEGDMYASMQKEASNVSVDSADDEDDDGLTYLD